MDLLNALAERRRVKVTLAWEKESLDYCQANGWGDATFSPLIEICSLSESLFFQSLVGRSDSKQAHVFSGFFTHPLVWRGYRMLRKSQAKCFAYTESFDLRGWRGMLRQIKAWICWRVLGGRIRQIFSIGERGRFFFESIGVPPQDITDFGYYFNPKLFPQPRSEGGAFKFIYVGQLIPRKGLIQLIQAWSRADLPIDRAQLVIIGAGPELDLLKRQVLSRSLSNVLFEPPIPNAEARLRIAGSDVLILPSLEDGWGATVSEALHVGVPVITTNRCGSSCLIQGEPERGQVVSYEDPEALASAINNAFNQGKASLQRREHIRAYAQTEISAEVAAERMEQIIFAA